MNQQTEALAKQAAEYAIEFATQDQEQYIPKLLEKFAEAIVRECVSCCGSQADKNNLLRHFDLPIESNVQYDAPPVHNSVTSQYTRKYNIP